MSKTRDDLDEFVSHAEKGDLDHLMLLIDQGMDVNSIDSKGRTALLAATEFENLKIIKWLLENEAQIDLYDEGNPTIERTPFLYAGANGLNTILDILIEYNPNYSIVNQYGGSALIPACERGHVETVRKLLEKTSIDINLVNNLGWTALLEAVILGDGGKNHQVIVKLLLDYGANPSIYDNEGILPLEHALKKGFAEISKIFRSELRK